MHMLSNNTAVVVIRTLHETLTEEAYNAIMDDAVSLVETGVADSNEDAIKFAASRIFDEETCRVVNAIIDEAILNEGLFNSPMKSKLTKLKEIKDAKPKEYEGPEAVKKFVDKYYDDIIKASRLLEKEPNELHRNEILYLISFVATFCAGYAAIAVSVTTASVVAGPALFGAGIASFILSFIISCVYPIIQYFRTSHDRDAADQLAKIRRSLKKVDPKKLPEEHRRKLDDCLEAIDDAETAISARVKVSNESASIMGSIWGDSMDESTKAGTIGANALKGAATQAAISGAVGAVAGATIDPNVRAARKELRKAEADDDDDRIAEAKEKLKAARIAGAKRGAIRGARNGAVGGAVSGAFDGAEKYKETHTGPNGEPIIDVKNYAEKKSKKTKSVDEAVSTMTIKCPSCSQMFQTPSQRGGSGVCPKCGAKLAYTADGMKSV